MKLLGFIDEILDSYKSTNGFVEEIRFGSTVWKELLEELEEYVYPDDIGGVPDECTYNTQGDSLKLKLDEDAPPLSIDWVNRA